MPANWSTKFELKPGRWVFVPTSEAALAGQKIKRAIEQRWQSPAYYYHLRAGGHVLALKSHLHNSTFLHLDVEYFFGSINKTRVTRNLKQIVGYALAREWANSSTVLHPLERTRTILPYGFVQSPIVASVCLEGSALGKYLDHINGKNGIVVSVYVDDIVISSSDSSVLDDVYWAVKIAAGRASFGFNQRKEQVPASRVLAFNIHLSSGSLAIEDRRYQKFMSALDNSTSDAQRQGIVSYINSIHRA